MVKMRFSNFSSGLSRKLSKAKASMENSANKVAAFPASRKLHKEFQTESSRMHDVINSEKATILLIERR